MNDRAMSGGEFARRFHADVVAPLLAQAMPGLGYAAGRLGPQLAGLPALIGSIEQWVSSVDLLASPARRAALRAAYVALAGLG